MYNKIGLFEKETHKVNLGRSFLSDKSAREMTYLSNSLLRENFIKPLNEGRKLYFSLLYDGSSSTKINDEKELYIIKTCRYRLPHFNVLSLQQPDDTKTAGLHVALQNSIESAKFTFDRKNGEDGVGSDGASANKSLYWLGKGSVGDHLTFAWCLSHEVQLALHGAFTGSQLETDAQKQLENEFYLFKKATLKWRLFKQYAAILEKTAYRYKHSESTRWVSHQVETLKVHLENLPVMLTFTNEQLKLLHNATMQKEKSQLEVIRREACNLKVLIYQAICYDIMRYTVPCSLAVESASQLMPEAITQIDKNHFRARYCDIQ